ncbi:MAG: cell envelope integrity protein TolA [Alphaproteobacteria bacterium]|nr:cell envelope integrity protein TolA [Alphaproteobacteria bacterium]
MKSALHPSNQSLLIPFIGSIVGHGLMIGGFAGVTMLLTFCGPRKPIIDPNDTIEVAMVSLPKSKSNMPDRATRAPQVAGAPAPEPAPAPDVKHTSDLAVKTDKAKTNPGNDAKKLEDALRELEQQAAMDAALGALNQSATDPDSETEEGASSGNVGTPSDPEYVKYILQIQKLFDDQFHPLQSIKDANPGIKCVIHVTVEAGTGRIVRYDVSRPSGNEAWDAAAKRAVEAITAIPLPPEKYRDRMGKGYDIEF